MAAPIEVRRVELAGLGRDRSVSGCVLVLNGATPDDLQRACSAADELTEQPLLVAVDGGGDTLRADGRPIGLFVGDGDSCREVPADVPALRFSEDKNFSDLAGALAELRRRHVAIVVVAGLLGGRLDHEWANLFELGSSAGAFAGVIAPSERGTVIVTSRGLRAETEPDSLVSLLALSDQATVSLRGPRWELERCRIRPGSRGLSNVNGRELDLEVHTGTVALVFPSV